MSLSEVSFESNAPTSAFTSRIALAQLEPLTFLKNSLELRDPSQRLSVKKFTHLTSSDSISFHKEIPHFFKDQNISSKFDFQKNKHYLILKNHLKGKVKSPGYKTKILTFVKMVMARFKDKENGSLTDMIGQIIFLSDRDFQGLIDCLELKDLEQSVAKIQQLFQHYLDDRVKRVEDWIERQEKLDSHEAQIFSYNRIPVEIADFILTKQGILNQALIAHIITLFKNSKKDELDPFKQNLIRKLLFLKNSEKANELIQSVKLSPHRHSPARQVIRTVLKLPTQTILTHTHAKQAAIAAFLSHFRQPISGGCFANSLTIELLSSKFLSCLNDFKELLYTDTLSRVVQSQKKVFPFLISTPYHDLDKTLEIEPSGRVNGKGFIWEDAGIESVCKALKIESSKSKVMHALRLKKNAYATTYTVRQILTRLAHYSKKRSRLTVSQVYGLYESKKTNLLLQAWNNAIAGMAEADDGSMIKSAAIRSILFALNINFTSPFAPYSEMNHHKKNLMNFLGQELSDRMQFLYDANLAKDQGSSGFILYDRNHCETPHRWIRIDSEEAFQKFIKSVLTKYNQTVPNDKLALCMLRGLKRYAESKAFIARLLHDYHSSWLNGNYKKNAKIESTPWKTLSGNNALKVIQIYFEKEELPKQEALVPFDAYELLQKILEIGKKYTHNPQTYRLYPVRVLGLHSFSLVLWHPFLVQLIQSSDPLQLIAQKKALINKEITERFLDLSVQNKILGALKKNSLFEPKLASSLQSLDFAFPQPITFGNFRMQLLEILKPHLPTHPSAIAWIIDTLIYDQLSDQNKQLLFDSAITFADTNWNYGSSDIYFCFVINPFTNKLELWENLSHDKLLQPLNQDFWLKNRTWEFLENPNEYFDESELEAA